MRKLIAAIALVPMIVVGATIGTTEALSSTCTQSETLTLSPYFVNNNALGLRGLYVAATNSAEQSATLAIAGTITVTEIATQIPNSKFAAFMTGNNIGQRKLNWLTIKGKDGRTFSVSLEKDYSEIDTGSDPNSITHECKLSYTAYTPNEIAGCVTFKCWIN